MPKLTEAAVQKLKPFREVREVPDDGAAGLRLAIHPSGSRSFIMRFRDPNTKKHVKLTLGRAGLPAEEVKEDPDLGSPTQALTLKAARALALKVLRQRDAGTDVVAAHKEKKKRQGGAETSFAAVAMRFIREHSMRNRSWRLATARVLGYDYPRDGSEATILKGSLVDRWRTRPIAEISGLDISAVVRAAVTDGVPGRERRTSGPSDARGRSLRKALHKLFAWALAHDLVTANPAAGRYTPPPAKSRDRVLTFDELKRVWLAADAIGYPFGHCVKGLRGNSGPARLGQYVRFFSQR
jgi:hypothetical protein